MFYWIVGLFWAVGWWVAGGVIVPQAVKELNITEMNEFGFYAFVVLISGLVVGAIWPASIFAAFWLAVFFLIIKAVKKKAAKAAQAEKAA